MLLELLELQLFLHQHKRGNQQLLENPSWREWSWMRRLQPILREAGTPKFCRSSSTNLLEVIKSREDDLVAPSDQADGCQELQHQRLCPGGKTKGHTQHLIHPPCLGENGGVWKPLC